MVNLFENQLFGVNKLNDGFVCDQEFTPYSHIIGDSTSSDIICPVDDRLNPHWIAAANEFAPSAQEPRGRDE